MVVGLSSAILFQLEAGAVCRLLKCNLTQYTLPYPHRHMYEPPSCAMRLSLVKGYQEG